MISKRRKKAGLREMIWKLYLSVICIGVVVYYFSTDNASPQLAKAYVRHVQVFYDVIFLSIIWKVLPCRYISTCYLDFEMVEAPHAAYIRFAKGG